ncbi:MAG: hemolysin III family protein [gamma proteobacterium symbiont of Bathyaustriella thionipta]|nr:hemolysin III family protein [gamma proteobacterium symbiont of Bathyaustriella thionipta]
MQSNVIEAEYSLAEEIAHTISHGIGIALSIAGLVVLVAFSALYGNAWHIASSSIFGATLILLYTASTLYHGVSHVRAKAVLQHCDHAAIYLLIAGTYTPFTLVSLRNSEWGWILFGLIWSLALLGVCMQIIAPHKEKLSLALYMLMGWLVVIAINPMLDAVATGGLLLLLIGGLCYTIGAVFFVWEKLAYNHAIWHLFVLAGSVFHFFSILFYVVPSAPA